MRVLILGGTTEASRLADALAGDARHDATLSLAGVTRNPKLPAIPVRIGGFGGADGLAAWLRAHGTDALVDATHPFAQAISRNAVLAAAEASVPLLRVARPEWRPVPGDRWTLVPTMPAAAAALGPERRRVLLTVGTREVAAFRDAPQHDYLLRSVDPPPPELLPPDCRVLALRGPFTPEGELALLREHGIQVIVSKNSGGTATAAKLEAARRLRLPVILVARPPENGTAASVPGWQGALAWLEARHRASTSRRV